MKLSVITVCLNSRRFIGQTIESVLAQDHPEIEHVIVDGGSSDGTVELVRDYALRDPRIRWISEPDYGISDAMNKGMAMVSGDVIAHLNSDDYYAHAGVLSLVADRFVSSPSPGWLTGGLTFVDEAGQVLREVRVRRYSFRRLLRNNIILHPTTFIRKDVVDATGGFDARLKYCMDYELFLRLGSLGPPFLLNEQLTCFRVHSGSRSVVQAARAYEEELQVRLDYLRNSGRPTWFYRLDYQLKRRLNDLFYSKMLSSSRGSHRQGG